MILLDINMPDMDGLEVCRRIRDHVDCPILFLTARVEEEDRIQGLMTGGDDYILKPFSIQELAARVSAHLRRERRSRTREHVRRIRMKIGKYTDAVYIETVWVIGYKWIG